MAKHLPESGTGVQDPLLALERIAARAAGQMAGENFPVALRLLPGSVRADLARVYRFARFVDDVGDAAGGTNCARLLLLDVVDGDLRDLAGGRRTRLSPVTALRPLTATRGVPVQPFRDLVEANRVDQRVASYPTFADLLGYCELSAAPVGRIVLHVAGAATGQNLTDSDAVCAALQVLEHCQDVREDAVAGRVYLPGDDLAAEGVEPGILTGAVTGAGLRRVVATQVARSRELLRAGRPLVRRLTGWARFAVAGYVAGGLATADALERGDYDVLDHTIAPGRLATVRHAVGAIRR